MEAKNATEQVVLDYFEQHASEDLKKRVDAEKKTIAGALHYAAEQAEKQQVGNCAVVADDVVFGWCMHYFEDERAEAHEGKAFPARVAHGRKKAPKRKPIKKAEPIKTPVAVVPVASKKEMAERNAGQLFLFDVDGGAA